MKDNNKRQEINESKSTTQSQRSCQRTCCPEHQPTGGTSTSIASSVPSPPHCFRPLFSINQQIINQFELLFFNKIIKIMGHLIMYYFQNIFPKTSPPCVNKIKYTSMLFIFKVIIFRDTGIYA